MSFRFSDGHATSAGRVRGEQTVENTRHEVAVNGAKIDHKAETKARSIPMVILSAETQSGRLHLEPAEFAQTSWKGGLIKKIGKLVQRADRKPASWHFQPRSIRGDVFEPLKVALRNNRRPQGCPLVDRPPTAQ